MPTHSLPVFYTKTITAPPGISPNNGTTTAINPKLQPPTGPRLAAAAPAGTRVCDGPVGLGTVTVPLLDGIGPGEMVGMTMIVLDEIESSTDEDGMTTSSDEEDGSMMTISEEEVEMEGSESTVSAVVMGSVPSGQVSGGMA